MSYLFNKFKEQATSIQQIAKTYMVYEKEEDKDENGEDEEEYEEEDDHQNQTASSSNGSTVQRKSSKPDSIEQTPQPKP